MLVKIFASSHQTDYVLLITEYFVRWFCASDAEKAIITKAFLFRKTKNGENIFSDRFVEWCVRYLRMPTGNKARTGDFANVVKCAGLHMNERSHLKQAAKQEGVPSALAPPDTEKEQKKLKLDKVMQESMLYTRDLNLFGTGRPRHVPPAPWKRRRFHDATAWEEASETEIRSPSGDVVVNPDLLSFLDIGGDRIKRYFERFPKNGDRKNTKRPETVKENGIALTRIESTQVQAKTKQANKVEKYVSLDKAFLLTRGLFTAVECKRDLADLNGQLVEQAGGDESVRLKLSKNDKGNSNKECYIDTIIKLQQKLIAGNTLWVEL